MFLRYVACFVLCFQLPLWGKWSFYLDWVGTNPQIDGSTHNFVQTTQRFFDLFKKGATYAKYACPTVCLNTNKLLFAQNRKALSKLSRNSKGHFHVIIVEDRITYLKQRFPQHIHPLTLLEKNVCGEGSPVMASNILRLLPEVKSYFHFDMDTFKREVKNFKNHKRSLLHILLSTSLENTPRVAFLRCSPHSKPLQGCNPQRHYGLEKKGCCFDEDPAWVSNYSFGIVTPSEDMRLSLIDRMLKNLSGEALLDLEEGPLLYNALRNHTIHHIKEKVGIAGRKEGARTGKKFIIALLEDSDQYYFPIEPKDAKRGGGHVSNDTKDTVDFNMDVAKKLFPTLYKNLKTLHEPSCVMP